MFARSLLRTASIASRSKCLLTRSSSARSFASTSDQPLTNTQLKDLISGWEKSKEEKSKKKDVRIQPGMKISSATGRLAHDLFDLAATKGEAGLSSVESDIKTLSEFMQQNPDFEVVLDNKQFQQTKLAEFSKSQLGLSDLTVAFIENLAANRQIRQFKDIIADFTRLIKSYRKEIDARLTIAQELNAEQLETLKKEIREQYLQLQPDEKLNLIIKIDPSLRGGFELYAKGNYVDMSLNRRLQSMLNKFRDDEIAQFLNPEYESSKRREQNAQLARSIGDNIRKLAASTR